MNFFKKRIKYLRISVTDRCNFKCLYCIPYGDELRERNRNAILSFEEIEAIVKWFVSKGVVKVRLTGGEPLLRRQLDKLIVRIKNIRHLKEVVLTTNGYFLEDLALDLKKAGLDRINVSLDTINSNKFKSITGGDLKRVIRGINKALRAGFEEIKINTVIMRGVNEEDICEIIRFCKINSLEPRFIELMPTDENSAFFEERFVPAKEIREVIEGIFGPIERVDSLSLGPARNFIIPSLRNMRIGLIPSVTGCICYECNRIRVTCDGKVIPCIMRGEKYEVGKFVGRFMNFKDLGLMIKSKKAEITNMCEIGG
jgi:cyclic pyranopterin phosphate synthase